VTDARLVAEAAIGARTLTAEERALADVAPPFGVIDVTDARFLAEAALGLRAVSLTQAPRAAQELTVWEWLLRLLGLAKPANEVKLASVREGLRIELPGGAVDAQGAVRYDPRQGEALELAGEGGWLVLAQAIDSERGMVKFAAVRLSSEPGALVLRMARGRAVNTQVELTVLRDARGRDLGYRVQSASTASVAVVQVVPQGNALSFRVQGASGLAVEVYDLGGRAVYRSGFTSGSTLRWNLLDGQGSRVANGVYLYIVQIRDAAGQITRTEVRKLLVLR
jgi:hypothetical protein